ncbi:MAG: hypothetical protein WKF34_12665 [Pyrinomonadaceae bacterium]
MIQFTIIFVFLMLTAMPSFAQVSAGTKIPAALATVPSADDVAKSALTAHGGEKLKKMRSIVMKGSVDLNAMGQAMPGAFSTAVSGEKYFFEINSVAQRLKQVYDGKETYSSIDGFSLPPVTSMGFPLLPRVGDAGFVITALGEGKKKKKGFRMTTPEGFYTDFYLDEKTNQIKGYDSAFEVGGRVVTTSVEIDEMILVEGITVPKKYSQRFDLDKITAYANFNTKTVMINSPIEDAAFAIPK